MENNEGFLSYSRRDKEAIVELVKWIEGRGLSVWYDDKLLLGKYDEKINDVIESSSVFISVLTKSGALRSDASGWMACELETAKEVPKCKILPCIIGDFEMNMSFKALIYGEQAVKADRIEDLPKNEDFQNYIDLLAKRGGEDAATRFMKARHQESRDEVEKWYDGKASKPPSAADQALALCIASLPDVPLDIVTHAASDLTEMIEARLRDLTEEELQAQPRGIGLESLSDRLKRLEAKRVCITHDDDRQIYVIRFTQPGWGDELINHVWTEREDVRSVYLDWLVLKAKNRATHGLGRYAARAIGSLAQNHLKSVRFMVLDDWLTMDDPGRFRQLVPLVADVMHAAVEAPCNVCEIKNILLRLASAQGGGYLGQQAALKITLGETGLRRPGMAVDILKEIGWEIFSHNNLPFVLRSPAFYGSSAPTDLGLSENIVEEVPDDNAVNAEGGTDKDIADEPQPVGGEGSDQGHEDSEQTDSENQKGDAPAAIPAMGFIAALADWADEPIKARTRAEQEDGKLKRQVPIAAMLLIFGSMPLLSERDSNRLTLEEMMRVAKRWDSALFDRIISGLKRAGMATHYRGDGRPSYAGNYFPPNHLSNVLSEFAKKRRQQILGKGLSSENRPDKALQFDGDPLLEFTARLYQSLDQADQNAKHPREVASRAIARMKQYLDEDDVCAIIGTHSA